MADATQQPAVPTAFAPPPPLWKHFTRENLDQLERIKNEASKGEDGRINRNKQWSPSELRALDVPPELRFLVPPEIPTGQYSVFGELQSVSWRRKHVSGGLTDLVLMQLSTTLPSLKEQGIEQLYPEPEDDTSHDPSKPSPLNHAYYLLKISKSLLLNFLEFVGVLSVSPEQFESKVEDMRNLFINAHHLLNLFRPHQARESLIMMMEEQLQRSKDEIKQMDKVKADIESVLDQLEAEGRQVSSVEQPGDADHSKEAARRTVEDSRLVWDILDQET
jgi:mediator of RNA polymerase II transcription subunit 7